MTSLKEGYSEEYKCTCFGISLVVVVFSPGLVECFGSFIPQSGMEIAAVACYAAILALAYVAGITIDGIVPYSVKDWLIYPSVFEKGSKRPGCSIFEEIGSGRARDFRFEIDSAREKYGKQIAVASGKGQADSAKYQNAEWYKLYRKHSALSSVQSNHLGHLYSRDVFTLSVSVMLLSAIFDVLFALLGAFPPISAISVACVAGIAVASWISARWKAKRLVLTVVACDVAEGETGDTDEHN